MRLRLLVCLALLALPATASAQTDDAAYCVKLADLARRYLGQSSMGRNVADLDTAIATDDCQKGNTARAIPVLERKLVGAGFTLPKR